MYRPTNKPPSPSVFGFADEIQADILKLMAKEPLFSEAATHWIKPEYFQKPSQQWFAKAQIDFFEKHQVPPTSGEMIEVLKINSRDPEFRPDTAMAARALIGEVYNGNLSGTKDFTIDLVKDFAKQRAWQKAVTDAYPLIQQGDYEKVTEMMEQASNAVYDLDAGGYWYFEAVEARVKRRLTEDEDKKIIPLGIMELDLALRRGGIGPGEVVLWTARNGGGKSVALGHCSRRAIFEGNNVSYFSFEMSDEQNADRMDAGFTGVSMWNLGEEHQLVLAQIQRLRARFPRALMLRRYPTKQASVKDIRNCLIQIQRAHDWSPDMIVLDYAGIVQPPRDLKRKNEEFQEIMEEFRGLCIEFDAVGHTAAQLNRSGTEKKVADGTGIAGSWDQLGTVDYHYVINQDDEERRDEELRIFIDKSRDGLAQIEVGPLNTSWKNMCFVKHSNKPPWQVREELGI